MATTVGTIQYDAVINTDGLDSGASKVKGIIGGVGKVAAAAVAAGAVATAGLVIASVNAFKEYEQLVGGVDTLFKENSDTVQQYAQNAFKTAGMSANQYMETVTGFSASLLQGLGGDTAKAAQIADMAVTDMSDNANKFGTDISMIQNAYQGFAKDNFTMLDNLKLGYGGTASEMARLVNESGVMGDSFQATAENVRDIPFDQLLLAINKVQTEMGVTGTTAKEASATISGAMQATKASWENVLTAFGTGNNEMIKAAIDGLIESAMNLVNNISVIIPAILGGIGQLVTAFAAELPNILTLLIPILTDLLITAVDVVVTAVPQFLEAAIKLVVALAQGLAQSLPTLIPKLVDGLLNLIKVIVENLPLFVDAAIQMIVAIATGLADAYPKLIPAVVGAMMIIIEQVIRLLPVILEAGIKILVALIKGLADALPKLISYIPTIINTLIRELTKPSVLIMLVGAALQIILAVAVGLIQAIPQLIAVVPRIIASLIGAFLSNLGQMPSIGRDMLKGIWNGLSGAKDWLIGQIKGLMGSITGAIKSFFGIKSPSTLFRDEIGKNLALGVGEGFEDTMGGVAKDMQGAIPTPSIDVDSIGQVQATNGPTTVVVKVGEETIATKVIELINERTNLSGQNAILV